MQLSRSIQIQIQIQEQIQILHENDQDLYAISSIGIQFIQIRCSPSTRQRTLACKQGIFDVIRHELSSCLCLMHFQYDPVILGARAERINMPRPDSPEHFQIQGLTCLLLSVSVSLAPLWPVIRGFW